MTLRVYGVESASLNQLRVYAISATGDEPVVESLRVYSISGTGLVVPVLTLSAPTVVEPDQIITLQADPPEGMVAPDTFQWTISAGTIDSAGSTAWFRSPSGSPPVAGTTPVAHSVTVSVRGVLDGVTGDYVSATLIVLPQTQWARDPSTGQWVGASRLS